MKSDNAAIVGRKNDKAGLGIRSSVFWANRSFYAKYKQMSDLLKKTRDSVISSFLVNNLSHSLMVAHFLVSDLSNSITLLIKKEGLSESLV